jgi:hypothetical protein
MPTARPRGLRITERLFPPRSAEKHCFPQETSDLDIAIRDSCVLPPFLPVIAQCTAEQLGASLLARTFALPPSPFPLPPSLIPSSPRRIAIEVALPTGISLCIRCKRLCASTATRLLSDPPPRPAPHPPGPGSPTPGSCRFHRRDAGLGVRGHCRVIASDSASE